MSTPAAIRFIGKRIKEPFSGLYINHDANLTRMINDVLSINQKIIFFPIHILSSADRISARRKVSLDRMVDLKELKFVSNVEEYAICFSSMYFNMMDVYGAHYSDIKFEGSDTSAMINEEFSAVEGELSALRLNSNYLNNVVYIFDIYFPKVEKLDLNNDVNVKITTGAGREIFNGTFRYLEKIRSTFDNE